MQQIGLKRGFTLVELLLAIFLVSLFAYFVFSTPGEYKKQTIEINATNLPNFLQKNLSGNGELVCVNKCKRCYYLTANGAQIDTTFPLNVRVFNEYIIDKNSNPQKIELGRFKDSKVCLRLRHYQNGSISPVILDLGDSFLFIGSYFKDGAEFNSLNDAVEYWLKDSANTLRSRGEWYWKGLLLL